VVGFRVQIAKAFHPEATMAAGSAARQSTTATLQFQGLSGPMTGAAGDEARSNPGAWLDLSVRAGPHSEPGTGELHRPDPRRRPRLRLHPRWKTREGSQPTLSFLPGGRAPFPRRARHRSPGTLKQGRSPKGMTLPPKTPPRGAPWAPY
jgi:hypothetical protein